MKHTAPLLLTLAACTPVQDGPIDTPETNLPAWSGTQIGEEGDTGCNLIASPWEDDQVPESGRLPEDIPLGTWDGMFLSDNQGEADLQVTLEAVGDPLYLSPATHSPADCVDGVRQPATLAFFAGPLLEVELDVNIDATEDIRFVVMADEAQLSGELFAGVLPEDAVHLSLELKGVWENHWSGKLQWLLERTSSIEEAPAGTWEAE